MNQADKMRAQARSYVEQATAAEKQGLELIPFGAVNTTAKQLRKWAKDLEVKANEWDRLAAFKSAQRRAKR